MGLIDVKVNFLQDTGTGCNEEDWVTNYGRHLVDRDCAWS